MINDSITRLFPLELALRSGRNGLGGPDAILSIVQ